CRVSITGEALLPPRSSSRPRKTWWGSSSPNSCLPAAIRCEGRSGQPYTGPSSTKIAPVADQISISLSETRVGIAAGAPPVVIEITVANRQQVVDEFVLTVSGGQPDWYDLSRDKVPLFPGESAKVTLRLHPPQRWDVQAGDTTLTVTAQSRADAALYSQAGVVVSI